MTYREPDTELKSKIIWNLLQVGIETGVMLGNRVIPIRDQKDAVSEQAKLTLSIQFVDQPTMLDRTAALGHAFSEELVPNKLEDLFGVFIDEGDYMNYTIRVDQHNEIAAVNL